MTQYQVGNIYQNAIGHEEGCFFDISDSGGTIIVYFDQPEDYEIENFKANSRFEMRLVNFSNVMMFLVKFGDLNWMDCPYNPHLSKNLNHFDDAPGGLAVTVMLFDTRTGKLEALRLISLSNQFTSKIIKDVLDMLQASFDHRSYLIYLNDLFSRYSTNALVKMSTPGFKIN